MFELSKQGVVDVIGGDEPLCADTIEDLLPLLDRCANGGPPRLVLDLRQAPFIDSAGLNWILDARDRCADLGGLLHLAGPNPLCTEILEITGVAGQLEVYDNVLQAAGSFAR